MIFAQEKRQAPLLADATLAVLHLEPRYQ